MCRQWEGSWGAEGGCIRGIPSSIDVTLKLECVDPEVPTNPVVNEPDHYRGPEVVPRQANEISYTP